MAYTTLETGMSIVASGQIVSLDNGKIEKGDYFVRAEGDTGWRLFVASSVNSEDGWICFEGHPGLTAHATQCYKVRA